MPRKKKIVKSKKPINKRPSIQRNKKLKFGRALFTRKITVFILLFALVGSYFLLKSFAASSVGYSEAETLTGSGGLVVSDVFANGGKALKLVSNTAAVGSLTTTAPGTTVVLHAKGTQCAGAPQAKISIDGTQVLLSSVSGTTWGDYIATVPVTQGTHSLSAVFINPYSWSGRGKNGKGACVRELFLDYIQVQDNTPPPPVSDTTAPTISISSPSDGSTVSGTVSVTTSTSDNVGVAKVEFYIDNVLASSVTASPFNYSWNTLTASNASHTVKAVAYDAANNSTSSSKTVSVSNQVATSSPSGQAMPIGDLTGWRQVFADDFTTNVPLGSFPSAVSSKWWAYPNGWQDTSKHGQYNCSKVCSVQSGMLDLYIHSESGIHYVAAPVPLFPGEAYNAYDGVHTAWNGQQYGRYAVRFRSDALPLYKTAWLLWPDSNNWPHDGEIDFPEGNLDKNICAFMHWMNATSGSSQDGYCTTSTYPSWHTAVIEWSPTNTRFILDGNVVGNSTANIPSTAMHWVLQTETALSPEPAPDNATAGHVQIDWVTGYIRQ